MLQSLWALGQVGQGVFVQRIKKRIPRFEQGAFQGASFDEWAGVGEWIKALDEGGTRLSGAEQLTDADLRCGLAEADATAATTSGGEVAFLGEEIYGLGDMMPGELVSIRNSIHGELLLSVQGGIHQDAQRVIGEEREIHVQVVCGVSKGFGLP